MHADITDQLKPIVPDNGAWKTLGRGPHFTVSGFAYDRDAFFPILYRSDKVRSAKNAWSIPSGLAELGLNSAQQFAVELKEELGLEVLDVHETKLHGYYENIVCNKLGEDNWHWVIGVLSVQVKTLDTLINTEPHKHSEIRKISAVDFDPRSLVWTPGLGEWMNSHWRAVQRHILAEVSYGTPL